MAQNKVGRNDKCPCGSGGKFKQCCGAKGTDRTSPLLILAIAGILAAAIFFAISASRHDASTTAAAGRVWSAEHGHYH